MVLRAVHSLFFAAGEWPTFVDVDHYLVPRGEVDAEDVVAAMPAGLLYGVTPGQPVRDEQQIGLTVAGMAACAGAAEDLEVYLAVVRHAAELDLARLPGSDSAELLSSSLAASVEMPAAGRSELIGRLGALLVAESWGSGGSSEIDGGWRHTIGRRARRLRTVSTIEEYWELTHPEQAPSSPPPMTSPSLRVAPRETGAFVSYGDLLHPEVALAALPRLEAGHADNAIEESWKVLAQRLRQLTGLDTDGQDLVNSALGGKGPIRLGDINTPRGLSEHQGFSDLMRGLARIRNLRAHRPSAANVPEAEVAALLLLTSLCLTRLDAYETPAETTSSDDSSPAVVSDDVPTESV
jgi:uncharacterized protein (TIGR02391 family)